MGVVNNAEGIVVRGAAKDAQISTNASSPRPVDAPSDLMSITLRRNSRLEQRTAVDRPEAAAAP